jgi:hypothetical protein
MNIKPVEQGQIVWLSGPSSSGKTTSTKSLEGKGWLHLEADVEIPLRTVFVLRRDLTEALTIVESHLANPTPIDILDVMYGGKKPEMEPEFLIEYEKAKKTLTEFVNSKKSELEENFLIHLLDKAIEIARLGQNVILDHVPLINDPELKSDRVTLDQNSKNLWCYRDFKIEQQLKYVPADTLLLNVIRRNQNAVKDKNLGDYRIMTRVLKQYSERFIASTGSDREHLGTLKIDTLKKWVERAIKIEFFDIDPNHVFAFDGISDIDQAIEGRLNQFMIEVEDPVNATDPRGEKITEDKIEILKQKSLEYPALQDKIDQMIKSLLQNMGVSGEPEEIVLTYASYSGVKPTIIRDS